MCRANSSGGRRCPSASDPAYREAYNAIRRARYAANKKAVTGNTSENLNKSDLSNFSEIPHQANIIIDVKQSQTGIDVSENITEKSKVGYTTGNVISGIIDYTSLNDQSCKEFGLGIKNFYSEDEDSQELVYKMVKLSNLEAFKLNEKERNAIGFFTSANYEWFNNVLYGTEGAPQDKIDLAKEKVTLIDKAFNKVEKEQKIVYRGVSAYSRIFENTNVHDWANDNLKLGQEIVFDGYQSSTTSVDTAKTFIGAGDTGIFYEILTPEGINLTSMSNFADECEVMLPRDSRYMVVGVDNPEYGYTTVQLVAINSKGEVLDGTNKEKPAKISYIDKYVDESVIIDEDNEEDYIDYSEYADYLD